VTGSIGGVANYINGYGDSIKRSMSSDATLSGAQKTAVKPSGPTEKKTPPAGQAAKKALPAAGGAQKALPAAGGKPKALPAAPFQKAATPKANNQGPKPKQPTTSAARAPASGGTRSTASSTSAKSPANASKPTSNTTPDGKVRISPASRPRPAVGKTVARNSNAPTAKPKDPLGIGENFGSLNNKSRPQTGGPKASSGQQARKPSAADPLAIGEDIGSIGKKK
jgi:hypothetical protein